MRMTLPACLIDAGRGRCTRLTAEVDMEHWICCPSCRAYFELGAEFLVTSLRCPKCLAEFSAEQASAFPRERPVPLPPRPWFGWLLLPVHVAVFALAFAIHFLTEFFKQPSQALVGGVRVAVARDPDPLYWGLGFAALTVA